MLGAHNGLMDETTVVLLLPDRVGNLLGHSDLRARQQGNGCRDKGLHDERVWLLTIRIAPKKCGLL
jgi:hypothetical protein